MSQRLPAEWFLGTGRANAVVTWAITAVLVLVAVDGLLAFLLVDAVLAAAAAVTAIVSRPSSRGRGAGPSRGRCCCSRRRR